MGAVPGIRFGLAFCEASGSGRAGRVMTKRPSPSLMLNALAIGAGHTFLEGPPGSAIRSLIPSHRKLLRSKAVVVSVAETPGQ